MKNIGVIDADLLDNGTRHPNLALMKIAGYNKEKGNNVNLLFDYNNINDYDEVYLSKVFDFTKVPINYDDYKSLHIGGTGIFWDKAPDLPYEIEHHMPDYNLYDKWIEKEVGRGIKINKYKDYIDYSIGFATRGCIRKCPFCVNQKYDKVFRHSPVDEFLNNDRKYIYLWDDNILAYNKWQEVFDELSFTGKRFAFRQGMDIRLLTEEKAKVLANSKYHGDFIFAFDNIEDKKLIEEKLKLWRKHSNKSTKLYVLCGFDKNNRYDESFWEKDIIDTFERIKILMKYQCLPYIMRHENYEKSPYRGMYINIARWGNQPNFYKKQSLNEFVYISNAKETKTDDYASKRYMDHFKKIYPDIINTYCDLKYENFK